MNGLVLIALAIALPVFISACQQEKGYGVLVAEYFDGSSSTFFRMKVLLPNAEANYRLNYEMRSGQKICTLTGELDVKETPADDECPGTKGKGKIVCDDGKPIKIRWSMSSCKSGTGKSMGKGRAKFFFGYAHNKERAQDQLARITGNQN